MFHAGRSATPERRGQIVWLFIVIVLAGTVTACDEPARRAVSPDSVRDLVTVVADEDAESGDPGPSGEMIEQPVLEQRLPPAERIYFTHGSDIWRVPADDEPAPVTTDEAVTDFSASATGHRIAVLRIERDADSGDERFLPSIRLPAGDSLIDLGDLDGTFDLDQLSPIESLELSPSGNALALAHQNGAVSMVTLAGEVAQLIEPGEAVRPGQLAWSSDGRFLTYLDPWLPNEPSALYLLMPDRGVRQILVQPGEDEHGVVQAAWIPGTSQIAYIKSTESTIPYGGDLFVVDATTGNQRLLLSSSEIAPVAGAVDLAVSPDGTKVAATGYAPGDEFPTFAGIWLFQFPGGEHYELPIEHDGAVTDLWWLGDQLMFRAIDQPRTELPGVYTGQEGFKLYSYDPGTTGTEERYASEGESGGGDDPDGEGEVPFPRDPLIINR